MYNGDMFAEHGLLISTQLQLSHTLVWATFPSIMPTSASSTGQGDSLQNFLWQSLRNSLASQLPLGKNQSASLFTLISGETIPAVRVQD